MFSKGSDHGCDWNFLSLLGRISFSAELGKIIGNELYGSYTPPEQRCYVCLGSVSA
jgi:hypothetical protein